MKILSFIKKHGMFFEILLIIFLFIFGLFFLVNLNSNFDEVTEQNILKRNVKDYVELIGRDDLANYFNERGIPSISVDIERDHGIAPYYLFTPALLLSEYFPHFISLLWKLYTYCIFFASAIFLLLLIKYLFKNKTLAYLSSLLYLLSPRIFIDGMHNNKDIVLMSLIIIMIYFFFRLVKENKLRYVFLFSIFAALVCNVKIIGIFFTFVLGIAYFIYLYFGKKLNKKNIIYGILTVAITFMLFVVFTPAIWGTGKFLIIDYVKYCLDNSVNFRAIPSVLFEGQIYANDINPLPWYYLPKMICITLPIIIPVLFIFSLIVFIINFIKKKIINKDIKYLICAVFAMFIVPFLIAVLKHPNIYNGWRHFYFLYAFIMIISCYGLSYLLDNIKTKKIIIIFVVLTLSTNIFCIIKNGVANTAYYNILVGTKDISEKYELDYYNVTTLEAIKAFLNSDEIEKNEDGKLYLTTDGFNSRVIADFMATGPGYYKSKIVCVGKDNIKDYSDKVIYNISNTVYKTGKENEDRLAYSYNISGSSILKFYRVQ